MILAYRPTPAAITRMLDELKRTDPIAHEATWDIAEHLHKVHRLPLRDAFAIALADLN